MTNLCEKILYTLYAARYALVAFSVIFFIGISGAATQKEVHRDCAMCHIEKDSKELKAGLIETCLKCHPTSLGKDHPIGVVSSIIPESIPLDKDNKLTCVTCHEPHGKKTVGRLLRKDFNSLCIACHKM